MGRMRTGKPKGRPSKQGSLHKLLKIDDYLWKILDSERSPRERYNDTIKRILFEKTQTIDQLEWKNANLESENERLRLENDKIKKDKQIEMNIL
jgi:hypothetical protein